MFFVVKPILCEMQASSFVVLSFVSLIFVTSLYFVSLSVLCLYFVWYQCVFALWVGGHSASFKGSAHSYSVFFVSHNISSTIAIVNSARASFVILTFSWLFIKPAVLVP